MLIVFHAPGNQLLNLTHAVLEAHAAIGVGRLKPPHRRVLHGSPSRSVNCFFSVAAQVSLRAVSCGVLFLFPYLISTVVHSLSLVPLPPSLPPCLPAFMRHSFPPFRPFRPLSLSVSPSIPLSLCPVAGVAGAPVLTHTHDQKITVLQVNLPLIQPLMEAAGYNAADVPDDGDAVDESDDGDGDDNLGGGGGACVGHKRKRVRGEFDSDSEGTQEAEY
jgi:hypothetical protein